MAQDTAQPGPKRLGLKITRIRVNADPPADILNIEISDDRGVWTESFGSEALARAYLQGVQAGATMNGHLGLYEIPKEPSVYLNVPPGAR